MQVRKGPKILKWTDEKREELKRRLDLLKPAVFEHTPKQLEILAGAMAEPDEYPTEEGSWSTHSSGPGHYYEARKGKINYERAPKTYQQMIQSEFTFLFY